MNSNKNYTRKKSTERNSRNPTPNLIKHKNIEGKSIDSNNHVHKIHNDVNKKKIKTILSSNDGSRSRNSSRKKIAH